MSVTFPDLSGLKDESHTDSNAFESKDGETSTGSSGPVFWSSTLGGGKIVPQGDPSRKITPSHSEDYDYGGSDLEIEVTSKQTYNPPSDTDSDDRTPRRLLEPSRKARYESVDENDKEAGKKFKMKACKETGKSSTKSSSTTSRLFGGSQGKSPAASRFVRGTPASSRKALP
jgi:hypothetical protein